MAMTLSRRILVLVVTILMALTMVAGPVASGADVGPKKDGGKNNGWGDGNAGGQGHKDNPTQITGWGDGNGGGQGHPKNNVPPCEAC